MVMLQSRRKRLWQCCSFLTNRPGQWRFSHSLDPRERSKEKMFSSFQGKLVFILFLSLFFSTTACTPKTEPASVQPITQAPVVTPVNAPPTEEPTAITVPQTGIPEFVESEPLSTLTPEPPATPTTEPTLEPLPAGPLQIDFLTESGDEKYGTYYPASAYPAPMVVLMHWAPGDENDWSVIAAWLQNRGLVGSADQSGETWLDSSWFPPMPEGRSYGVLTFTFSGCDGGCTDFMPEQWQMEAEAAMAAAATLEGVDPNRLVAIGASIGADGAIDGCLLHNQTFPNQCQGALSLSPGSYLQMDYADTVEALEAEDLPKPAWCLYAPGDTDSAETCLMASGDNYLAVEYEGALHGMMLIGPDVKPEPNALQQILDFLELTLPE